MIGTFTRQGVAKTFCVSSRLGHANGLTREASHQNRVVKFLTFLQKKKKNFPKTIKILENLFVFDQHIIEHVQHI